MCVAFRVSCALKEGFGFAEVASLTSVRSVEQSESFEQSESLVLESLLVSKSGKFPKAQGASVLTLQQRKSKFSTVKGSSPSLDITRI